MSPEVAAAIIAAGVSIVGGVTSYFVQTAIHTRQFERAAEASLEARRQQAEELRSKYRDPLLASAYALHSRIFNIVDRHLFEQPAETEPRRSGRNYATESTLYALGEFLCWKEILRREVQFLDLGDDEATRSLNLCFEGIMDILAQNDPRLGRAFRLFRMEQRAIGELMIDSVEVEGGRALQAIGPAEFSRKLSTPEFASWFGPLEEGLGELPSREPGALARLALLQNWMVEFLDAFDPETVALAGKRDCLDVPEEFRHLGPPQREAES